MTALVIHRAAGRPRRAFAEAASRALATVRARLAARRDLLELSRLDDRALKDIGYCRTDLLAEGWDGVARDRAPVRPAPPER